MKTYIIKEVQNVNSDCDKGELITVKSLRGAKIVASRRQCFEETIIRIENQNGDWIAYKENGMWIDMSGTLLNGELLDY